MKKILLLSVSLMTLNLGFAQDKNSGRFHQGGPNGGAPGYYANHYSPPVMSPQDYAMALDAIGNRSFDDDRLAVAQQVASGGTLTSNHVAGIMDLFSFEDTRLDFAKFAYGRVVDPQNYYVVNNAFSFSSSIEELSEYMSTVSVGSHVVVTSGNCGVNSGPGPAPVGNTVISTGTMTASGGVCIGNGNVGVNSYYPPAPAAICHADFDRILCAVRGQTFDRDKVMVAKQAVMGRFLTAAMVSQIMHLFTFESSKLDFAKHAYASCIDRHNYYIVNNAFTFSSSTRELDSYIRHFH